MPALPDVPTVMESGYKDFEVIEWNGFFVPAGTPVSVIDTLAAAVRDAARQPDVQKRLLASGIEPVGNTPTEFAAFLKGQVERWTALVRSNNIQSD